jgi:hypothetical protein
MNHFDRASRGKCLMGCPADGLGRQNRQERPQSLSRSQQAVTDRVTQRLGPILRPIDGLTQMLLERLSAIIETALT